MDLAQIRQRLDEERRTVCMDDEILEQLHAITRVRSRTGSYYLVIYSRLTPTTVDAAITAEIEHHCGLGVEFEWKLYSHDTPPELPGLLEASGFSPGPVESVLVCDISSPPEWLRSADIAQVVPITDLSQVEIYRQLQSEIFPHADGRHADALALAVQQRSSQHRGYIAYAGDVPVSIGRLYVTSHSHFAGLYGGGTKPAYRGRGFYRALIAARARDAITLGARYLLVDALPTSRPILERLGFQWLADTRPYQWHP